MKTFDAIVIGLGAMGAAALHQLAARGARVLGLEQYALGHDRGSSHGSTRIIRKAYFEHPDYVPLLDRAYALWADLEAASGHRLVERCGLVVAGSERSEVVAGIRLAARTHGLDIRELDRRQAAAHAGRFRFAEDDIVLFEPDAGFLYADACLAQLHAEARRRSAEIAAGEPVVDWRADAGGISVRTPAGEYAADRLIICAGPWAGSLLRRQLPLVVRRVPLFWLDAAAPALRLDRGCPVFAFDTPEGFFYGFPVFDAGGLKVAQHRGREIAPDPSLADRGQAPGDFPPVREFLRRHAPDAGERVQRFATCLYTMTPDQHFVVDRHPDHERVVFAAGFSGHGFKFAPVVGSVLADLALTGRTEAPVGFLSATRTALSRRA